LALQLGIATFAPNAVAQSLSCSSVPVAGGPEDVVIRWDEKLGGRLFASVDPRDGSGDDGRLQQLLLDNESSASTLQLIDANGEPWSGTTDFHPLGLAVVSEGGQEYLLVVNDGSVPGIERFLVKDDHLVHDRRWLSPLLTSPNGIAAISPSEFYVTNAALSHGFRRTLEWALGLPTGNVVHYRGDWRLVVDNLRFANGIAISPCDNRVYVAEFAARRVLAFDRDPATGQLEDVAAAGFTLPDHPDNLTWDSAGFLLVGAHVSVWHTFCHLQGICNQAPSRIYAATVPQTGSAAAAAIIELEPNADTRLRAATTAARYRDRIFVGQLRQPAILSCALRTPEDGKAIVRREVTQQTTAERCALNQ
jgi:sugar lactone lactonase YvrE